MSRVALVTGGNRGIGLSIAQLLRAGGYTVVVGSRTGTAPDGLNAVMMDVANTASIDAGFTEIEEKFGPVESLNGGPCSLTEGSVWAHHLYVFRGWHHRFCRSGQLFSG